MMENTLLLVAAIVSAGAAAIAFGFKKQPFVAAVLRALWGLTAGLLTLSLVLMVVYLLGGRYDYLYVYGHTDNSLPAVYRISALWSGQEGSFLLWGVCMAATGLFLPLRERKDRSIFGLFAAFSFCLFLMTYLTQPFARQEIMPAEGTGMAEALRDPWMVVHPPLVFISYSFMAVLAAKTISIPKGRAYLEPDIRRWVRLSWIFLGLGIFTGGIWAYRALGWGGYWAWDPIENAALVPWLVLCGYLHQRDTNRIRCALPLATACFGTFLTRSGILAEQSAHAYAGGNHTISVLLFFVLLGIGSWFAITKVIAMSRVRMRVIRKAVSLDKKRLFVYLVNSYALLIFLGTIAPIIFPFSTPIWFYVTVSILFALSYSALLLVWDKEVVKRRNIAMMVIATVLAALAALATGTVNYARLLLLWACLMPLSLWISDGFRSQRLRYYLFHAGMVLLIAGIVLSLGLSSETFVLAGQNSTSVEINGSVIPMDDILNKEVLTVSALSGDVVVQCSQRMALPDGSVAVPYITRPLIGLFWLGGFSILLAPWVVYLLKKIKRSLSNYELTKRIIGFKIKAIQKE